MARIVGAALSLVLLAAAARRGRGRPARARRRHRTGGRAPRCRPRPGGRRSLSRAQAAGVPEQPARSQPSMSADARFVAFTSAASDLVAGEPSRATRRVRARPPHRRTSRWRRSCPTSRRTAGAYAPEPVDLGRRALRRVHVPAALVRPAGSSAPVRRLIGIGTSATTRGADPRRTSGGSTAASPAISADGRYVAFTTGVDVPDGQGRRRGGRRPLGPPVARRWCSSARGSTASGSRGCANRPSISGNGNAGRVRLRRRRLGRERGHRQRACRSTSATSPRGAPSRSPRRPDGAPPARRRDRPGHLAATAGTSRSPRRRRNLTPDHGPAACSAATARPDRTIRVSVTPTGDVRRTATNGSPSITADGNDGHLGRRRPPTSSPRRPAGSAPAAFVPGRQRRLHPGHQRGRDRADLGQPRQRPGRRPEPPAHHRRGRPVRRVRVDSPNLVRGDDNKAFDVFLRDLPPVPVLNPQPALDFGPARRSARTARRWPPRWPTPAGRRSPWATRASRARTPRTSGSSPTGAGRKVLRRAQACTVSVVFSPSARAAGPRPSRWRQLEGTPRTVRLRGNAAAVPGAKLEISPEIGKPGIVTIATGSGFPPNTAGARFAGPRASRRRWTP